jgi:hypothetical protein
MGLKGYRLWIMGQLDSNVQSPTEMQHFGQQAPATQPHVRRGYQPLAPGRELGVPPMLREPFRSGTSCILKKAKAWNQFLA